MMRSLFQQPIIINTALLSPDSVFWDLLDAQGMVPWFDARPPKYILGSTPQLPCGLTLTTSILS